ncbi:MAG: glycosyltransferase [Acidobacteriaceae bacterium]|nr:glycosyltransferase [Acidobacteriaceae bacterium]
MVILTNIENFPSAWQTESGFAGESRIVHSAREYLAAGAGLPAAVALVNCDPTLTLELAGLLQVTQRRLPLVALDLVLRRPQSWPGRLAIPLKRLILRRVDLFIHYFRDLRAYERLFGVGPERSAFVPFKVNLLKESRPGYTPDGEYVLCFGRTLRDFDTFFAAMEQLPYPGAISEPDFPELKLHGARFSRTLEELPQNVRALDDDGSMQTMLRILERAKIVVVPVLKTSTAASGCSTYLNAMCLGKCVIGTEGPGLSDVFQNGEVLSVPPEDPAALAAAVRRAWEDDELRRRTGAAGYRYAALAGGEQELYRRVIEQVVSWYGVEYLPRRVALQRAS